MLGPPRPTTRSSCSSACGHSAATRSAKELLPSVTESQDYRARRTRVDSQMSAGRAEKLDCKETRADYDPHAAKAPRGVNAAMDMTDFGRSWRRLGMAVLVASAAAIGQA